MIVNQVRDAEILRGIHCAFVRRDGIGKGCQLAREAVVVSRILELAQVVERPRERARQNAGFTQETMAVRLGVARCTYELYECRSPLPHELIKPFCTLANIGPAELYKGTLARLADLHPKEREWLDSEKCSRN